MTAAAVVGTRALDAQSSRATRVNVAVYLPAGEAPAWLSRCLETLEGEGTLAWSVTALPELPRDGVWTRVDAWLARRAAPSAHDAWAGASAREPREPVGEPHALGIDIDRGAGERAETVWSVCFGDGSRYANELARGDEMLAIEIHERAPDGTERCVARTRTKAPSSLTLARNRAAWKASALLERCLRRRLRGETPSNIAFDSSPAARLSLEAPCSPAAQSSVAPPLSRATPRARVWWLAMRTLARGADRTLREDAWRLAWRARGCALPDAATWRPEHELFAPRDRFYADPFLLTHAGRECLFFEDFDARARRGRLACVELAADGSAGPVRAVERAPQVAHHLSYPFVFEHDGVAYMLPETHEARRIELWRADEFPTRWSLERVLVDDVRAVDATWFRHGGRFWLFACIADEHSPRSEELCAFWSAAPFGPWTAHASNPIVDDPCGARPAGRPFLLGDRLVRPAQDVSGEYGRRVLFQEILELDPTRYAERTLTAFDARGPLAGAGTHHFAGAGTHHFDRGERFEVVDVRTARWKRPRWPW